MGSAPLPIHNSVGNEPIYLKFVLNMHGIVGKQGTKFRLLSLRSSGVVDVNRYRMS